MNMSATKMAETRRVAEHVSILELHRDFEHVEAADGEIQLRGTLLHR